MAHNKLRREITAYMEGGPSSTVGMLTTAHQLLVRAFEALGGPVGDTRTEKSRDLAQGYGMSAKRAAIQFPVGRIDVEEEAGPDAMTTPCPLTQALQDAIEVVGRAPTEAEWQDLGRPSHGLGASESE